MLFLIFVVWLYYSRFLFWWEEGGGGERTPEPGMLSGLRLRRGLASRLPGICSPPAAADQTASPARAVRFKAVGLGWLGGSWMSRQRCAGRRGGKAEFPCGLMGRGWAEALRCRLGVCRIVVEFLDGFCVIFFLVYGMVGISYKIFCLYGHSWSFGF